MTVGPRLGRRRRRLAVTLGLLAVALVAAVAVAAWAARRGRGEVRRPGEALPEITDALGRDLPAEAPAPGLADVTAAAGLAEFRTFAGERTSQLPEDMGGGAAWGDFDGDGDEDLFLAAAGGALGAPPEEWAPSRLYENLGGAFRAVDSFPETRVVGMGAAFGDADGDGDLDLAVSGYRTLLLFRNQDGRFTRDPRFPAPEGFWAGISWADFDRDGDFDLYVCGYVRYQPPAPGEMRTSRQYGAAVPYTLNPASFAPESNLLLRNRGDGTFEEVALLWGVSNPEGRSLSALWRDFDDDGWLDLYVANDVSDNALFLNRAGETFEDVAHAAWVADYRGAMGLAAGDWNRDGDDDLFITHWLAQENALYDSRLRGAPPAAGTALLADPPAGAPRPRLGFSDLSSPLGLGQISLPVVGWGTEFADLDGDGWLDLVVANGSTVEDQRDRRRLEPQAPFLFWNRRGESFHDLAPLAPALAAPRVARGLALADYDLDGDLDVAIVELDAGVRLLRNDMQTGHWLELELRHRLRGDHWGRGEGATVVAWAGGVALRRSATGASYLGQSSRVLHFGLGAATAVERLEIRWPDGRIESRGPLAADARWQLRQGDPDAERLGGATLAREQVLAFWTKQRQAMDAMKREGDLAAAERLLGEALAIDPAHEDSRYYLAQCLWARGARAEALAQLDELRRRSPMSHRAHRQWAAFRALAAQGGADLEAASAAAARALEINREETGALLLLGEIALLQDRPELAGERLAAACRTNPKAAGGFYLQAYLAWRAGDAGQATALLERARAALGEHWTPKGAAGEGDVAARLHQDETPLSRFWQAWDGRSDPATAFAALAAHLAAR